MSVKTFTAPDVKKLIDEHFVTIEINVDHEKESAAWFQGDAIPDVRILSPEGKTLDRLIGFEEPELFSVRLRKWVEGR
jgi:hypothetical protein